MSKCLATIDMSLTAGSLESYVHKVYRVPMLSREEEEQLTQDFYQNNNIEAARRLVLAHLRYVVKIARGYSGYGLAQADLIQEGNIGLMKAVKRFDPKIGVRLVSFAIHWIKAEMHEYILKNWRIVKIATTKAQRKLFFNLRKSTKHLGNLNNKEAQQIAEDLKVPLREVRNMEIRLNRYYDESFDSPVYEDDDGGNSGSLSPAQYLTNSDQDPAKLLENYDWSNTQQDHLTEALSQLDDRSVDILQSRWLQDEKATLHDLAAKYQISAERVRQLEKKALTTLRSAIESQ